MSERAVFHLRYGRGVVKGARHKGFEVQVAFDDGLTRWVRSDELAETEVVRSVPPAAMHVPLAFSDECFKSRRMIEAFRLGIVPYDCVEEFTFGRDEETQNLMDWLDESDESTMLVVGEYGTGKSHLLHHTYGRALEEGFAVAYVEMDPNESPFHKPKRVYSRLVRTLQFRSKQDGQLKGFRDFLKEALARDAFNDHRYLRYLIGKTPDETLWDWIEARESSIRPWSLYGWRYSRLPGLYDYSTTANIYCYLLSALGWAAKEILGLKGLLLIFDEAEAVDVFYYNYQFEKGLNFLKALIRAGDNDESLLGSPYNTGLDYCGVGVGPYIPFLYKQLCGLKLLFAFTPIYILNWLHELQSALKIDLEPLTDIALKDVFEHICLLYDSAYDFLEEDLTIDAVFRRVTTQSGRTRLFVKGSVEALDLIRLSHGKALDEVLQ